MLLTHCYTIADDIIMKIPITEITNSVSGNKYPFLSLPGVKMVWSCEA